MGRRHRKGYAGAESYGIFTNFPEVRHGVASVRTGGTRFQVQRALAETLSQINAERRSAEISVANHPDTLEGEVSFEVGIANEDSFLFFDEAEKGRFLARLEAEGPFKVLDAFVIVRYSVPGVKKPPWLDRYIVRMEFSDVAIDMMVLHEKGLQRIDTEGIIRLLVEGLRRTLGGEVKILSLRTA